jgi:hypothetical protein
MGENYGSDAGVLPDVTPSRGGQTLGASGEKETTRPPPIRLTGRPRGAARLFCSSALAGLVRQDPGEFTRSRRLAMQLQQADRDQRDREPLDRLDHPIDRDFRQRRHHKAV